MISMGVLKVYTCFCLCRLYDDELKSTWRWPCSHAESLPQYWQVEVSHCSVFCCLAWSWFVCFDTYTHRNSYQVGLDTNWNVPSLVHFGREGVNLIAVEKSVVSFIKQVSRSWSVLCRIRIFFSVSCLVQNTFHFMPFKGLITVSIKIKVFQCVMLLFWYVGDCKRGSIWPWRWSRFLWNIGTHRPNCMVSCPRRL